MIVSASRRTDLSALYSDWLLTRLREGSCRVRHPFDARRVREVPLRADRTEALVLWTRNAAPLEPHLDELEQTGIPFYLLWTLTGYGGRLEPGLPPMRELAASFLRIARHLGPDRMVWRYDPLLVTSDTPLEYHRRNFRELARRLSGATWTVKISLVDYYAKVNRRLAPLEASGLRVDREFRQRAELTDTLDQMVEIASGAGMRIESCAEEMNLTGLGIEPGACIDAARLERISGRNFDARKDPGQRPACRCTRSVDIGAYDTCTHGCVYCYAVRSVNTARRRRARHDPMFPELVPPDPDLVRPHGGQ